MSALTARVVPVGTLCRAQRSAMYHLLQHTYDPPQYERFERELYANHDVILLVNPVTDTILGFSTLRYLELELNGELVDCVYSGDAVSDPAYWGQRALGRALMVELFKRRLRRPFRALYWMLLCKDDNTYLWMANNVEEHWPRWECKTPPRQQRMIDRTAGELFGADYDGDRGVVRFSKPMGPLKSGLADRTQERRQREPRVAYFTRKNPGWTRGEELVCLARISWMLPLRYGWKALRER